MTLAPVRISEAADSMAKASTPEPFSSSKTSNWVARRGGLPAYIQHIAHDLMEKRGKSESEAIGMAVGIVKRWARGGGNVDSGTRAAASKAVAEWEKLKAGNAAKSAVKESLTGELTVRDAALERLAVWEAVVGLDGMVGMLAEGVLAEAQQDASVQRVAEGLRFDLLTVAGLDIPPLRRVQEARRRDPFELVSEAFHPDELRGFGGKWIAGGGHHQPELTPRSLPARSTRPRSRLRSDARRRYEGGVARMSGETRRKLLGAFTDTERGAAKQRQPTSNLDELYKHAGPHHAEFSAILQTVAKKLGSNTGVHLKGATAMGDALRGAGADHPHVLLGSLKGRERATVKVNGKYKGDASRLNDVVRGAVAVPHVDDLPHAIKSVRESLPKGWTITAPENRFVRGRREDHVNTGDLNGYRDIAVILRSPKGFNVELQITTTHMQLAKGDGHKLYEERRKIAENGVSKQLSRSEAHRIKQIDQAAKEHYDKAMMRSSRQFRLAR